MIGGKREKRLEKNIKDCRPGSGHVVQGSVVTLVVVAMSPSFRGSVQRLPLKICMLELAGEI